MNMLNRYRGVFACLLCLAVLVVLMIVFGGDVQNYRDKYEGVDLTADVSGIGRSSTYDGYLAAHADAAPGTEKVEIDVSAFEGDGESRSEEGRACVYTPDNSLVTWKVNVPAAGWYQVRLDYLTTESRGVDIERELLINGEVPFSGASTLCFSRLWTDGGPVRQDNQGNDIRPSQIERFDWQSAYCRDDMGYQTEPYSFYFNEGENTLSLHAVNEPVIIGGICLEPVTEYRDYETYLASMPQEDNANAKDFSLTIQGETAQLRSSPSLYARYDRSSSLTVPSSVTNTVLNYIGGDPWTHPGEWIQWDFEVPEDGYYNIFLGAGFLSPRGAWMKSAWNWDETKAISFCPREGRG